VKLAVDLHCNYTVMSAFIHALSRGANHYQENNWVLAKRQIAPNAATLKTSNANIGRFFTPASLLAAEPTISGEAKIEMPVDGFWQKQPPTLTNQPNGTYIMEQEWIWAQDYEQLYYGVPI
jgi:hypothetical protein